VPTKISGTAREPCIFPSQAVFGRLRADNYGWNYMSKCLIIKPLQESAFVCGFSLTLLAYMLNLRAIRGNGQSAGGFHDRGELQLHTRQGKAQHALAGMGVVLMILFFGLVLSGLLALGV